MNLQALSYRKQELLSARGNTQSPLLVQELVSDIQNWRLAVQNIFQHLSLDPAARDQETFRTQIPEITSVGKGKL